MRVFSNCANAHYPNLATRSLSRVLTRLSDNWLAYWGHRVELVETFVDPEFFRGTTYIVPGWSELGPTSGFRQHAQDFYESQERPTQLWVKELVQGACQQRRAPQLPAAWAVVESKRKAGHSLAGRARRVCVRLSARRAPKARPTENTARQTHPGTAPARTLPGPARFRVAAAAPTRSTPASQIARSTTLEPRRGKP